LFVFSGVVYLMNVDIFRNSSSEQLYNVNELYLPFNSENMTIEFPNFTINKEKDEG